MTSSTSLPGARIGKYSILAHVATGGMGAVYKAYDEENDRVVALKILAPDLADNPILVERFKREARHAAKMSHKNLVTLYESDTAEGMHYLAMEFIDGVDLAEYIKRKGKLDPEEARRILIQACKALEHAFGLGITHRDIKPSNFLLANEAGRCRVKLTDLGLARMSSDEEFRVTRAGTTVGTVDYMSPEQARDASLADVRSDIYSLGCTLYHMLAGNPPFAEGGLGERVYKHLAADPPDVRQINDKVPLSLWTVLRRMLAKHPDDRFQTPTEVVEALRSIAVSGAIRKDAVEDSEVIQDEPPDATPAPPPSKPVVAAPEPPAPRRPQPRQAPRPVSPPQRKRNTTISEMNQTLSEGPDLLGITPEQRQAAAGQFSHATEVIRSGGDVAYATGMLLSCCKLDPSNVLYRKLLREVSRDHGKKGGWFGSLTNLPAKGRLRAAKKAGEHRAVLYDGEELLTKLPGDVQTQLDMAEAAESLNLNSLAIWLLEEARQSAPKDRTVLVTLANCYGRHKRWKHAVSVWEKVRDMDPSDPEPTAKIRELAVNETLSKGSYRG